MKPSLATLLVRTEAALFRAGYDASKLNPVTAPADERGGARVKIETYADGPAGWWVDADKLRRDLEREGLLPFAAGYPERPGTLFLWESFHRFLPPNGFAPDESP